MKQLFLSPVLALALVTLTGCEPTESPKPTGAAQAAPVAQYATPRPSPAPETVIPRGTALRVRLSHAVSTEANRPGDPFTATLDEPLVINGKTVLPKGTGLRGTIRESDDSGRLTGRAVLALTLESVDCNGRTYAMRTETHRRVSASHKKRNAVLVGGGSGLGALLGGIAGGGRGALIGAGAGAAAGTAGAAATGRREIRIPAESVLRFRLREPLSIEG